METDVHLHYLTLESPIGTLTVAASATALHAIEFAHNRHPQPRADWVRGDTALLRQAADQLRAYFAGQRRHFELPLAPQGTEFQRAAWQALAAIPYGETRSYAQQAAALGKPAATRAVGAANGRTPLPIVLP